MKTKLESPTSTQSQAEFLISALIGCINHTTPEEVAAKAIQLTEDAQASFADKALLSAYLMAIARDLISQWAVDAIEGSVTAEQREDEEDESKLIGLSVALREASNDCDKSADLLFNLARDCPDSIR
jgi:hypothetical protein